MAELPPIHALRSRQKSLSLLAGVRLRQGSVAGVGGRVVAEACTSRYYGTCRCLHTDRLGGGAGQSVNPLVTLRLFFAAHASLSNSSVCGVDSKTRQNCSSVIAPLLSVSSGRLVSGGRLLFSALCRGDLEMPGLATLLSALSSPNFPQSSRTEGRSFGEI